MLLKEKLMDLSLLKSTRAVQTCHNYKKYENNLSYPVVYLEDIKYSLRFIQQISLIIVAFPRLFGTVRLTVHVEHIELGLVRWQASFYPAHHGIWKTRQLGFSNRRHPRSGWERCGLGEFSPFSGAGG